MATLGTIPLHPALALPWANPSGNSGNGGGGGGSGGNGGGSGSGGVDGGGGSRVGTFVERSSRRGMGVGGESGALDGTGMQSGGQGKGRLPDPPPPSPSQQQQQQQPPRAGEATLLDCVPVEREQKLLESCRTSQRRFRQEAEAVAQKYAAIKKVRKKRAHRRFVFS